MFVTEKLNILSELIETKGISEQLKNILQQQYVNLEATLLRAKVLRGFSKLKVHYIIQSEIQAEQASLAFLFSPFILANLNKTVIYNTPATLPVLNILNTYYQAEKKQKRRTRYHRVDTFLLKSIPLCYTEILNEIVKINLQGFENRPLSFYVRKVHA